MKRKLLSVLLVLSMVFSLLPSITIFASADPLKEPEPIEIQTAPKISYIGADGNTVTGFTGYSVVGPATADTSIGTSGSTSWVAVIADTTIDGNLTINGDVNLILCDGAKLTVTQSHSVIVTEGNSLTIYGQEKCTGLLTVVNQNGDNAAIGGTSSAECGTITINGGCVYAKAYNGAGIGGGNGKNGGTITINGGVVNAVNEQYGDHGKAIAKGKNATSDGNVVIASKMLISSGASVNTDNTVYKEDGVAFDYATATSFKDARNVLIAKPDYLTLTAEEDNSTINFSWQYAQTGVKIRACSTDVEIGDDFATGEWQDYVECATITLQQGEYVQFRGINVYTGGWNGTKKQHFVMTGKIAASGSVTSLIDANGGDATTPANNSTGSWLQYMFADCASLTKAPKLISVTLERGYIYAWMFINCTGLTEAPELPATTLSANCYDSMFQGCKNLKEAPELPATKLGDRCYDEMFVDCTSLTKAPALPATELTGYCYWRMFAGCTSLVEAPTLPATQLAEGCYWGMFENCSSLVKAPALPAKKVYEGSYKEMFYNCTSLVEAPALPATELAYRCYEEMFKDCKSLTKAPDLPATKLEKECYCNMFSYCSGLTKAPRLVATELAEKCYYEMFDGCWSLSIQEGTAANYDWKIPYYTDSTAVENMISGTRSESLSVQLPTATGQTKYYLITDRLTFKNVGSTNELATISFNWSGGSSVKVYSSDWDVRINNNSLPYESRGTWIQYNPGDIITFHSDTTVQFRGTNVTTNSENHFTMTGKISASGSVTSLTDGNGADTSVTLTANCYESMFEGCTALTTAPTLPAKTLAASCYKNMFKGCTGLTDVPMLEATTLTNNCYEGMFNGCTGVSICRGDANNYKWAIPATSGVTDATTDMIKDTASPVSTIDVPTTGTNYYKLMPEPDYLTFTAQEDSTIKFAWDLGSNVQIKASSESVTVGSTAATGEWQTYTANDLIGLPTGTFVQFKGTNVKTNKSSKYFVMTGKIAASGSVTSLTDGNGGDENVVLYDYAYTNMFQGCEALVTAPKLPAKNLSDYCYDYMFYGCDGLTEAPELPAETLAVGCYKEMFEHCDNLTKAPKLEATTLAALCYSQMFLDCEKILVAEGTEEDYTWRIPQFSYVPGASPVSDMVGRSCFDRGDADVEIPTGATVYNYYKLIDPVASLAADNYNTFYFATVESVIDAINDNMMAGCSLSADTAPFIITILRNCEMGSKCVESKALKVEYGDESLEVNGRDIIFTVADESVTLTLTGAMLIGTNGEGRTVTFKGNGEKTLTIKPKLTDSKNTFRPVAIRSGNTMVIEDGAIFTGSAFNNGANTSNGGMINVANGATLTMNGGKITNCSAENGGAVNVSGAFNMNGGEISGCSATKLGGAVFVAYDGKLVLTNGTVKKNTAATAGGAVYSHGIVEMNGGTITGCFVTGTVENDVNKSKGGAVYLISGTGKFSGGTITGNYVNKATDDAQAKGGGVYVASGASVTVGGTVKINGNSVKQGESTTENNVYIYTSTNISVGNGIEEGKNGVKAPASGMSVGITKAEGCGKFTIDGTADASAYFFSDNGIYKVKFNKGTDEQATTDDYLELVKYTVTEITTITKSVVLEKTDKSTDIGSDLAKKIADDNGKSANDVFIYAANTTNGKYKYIKYSGSAWTDSEDTIANIVALDGNSYVIGTKADKDKVSITAVMYNDSNKVVYDGNAVDSLVLLTKVGQTTVSPKMSYSYFNSESNPISAPTNVGTYSVKIKVADDDPNYYSDEVTVNFEITQGKNTIKTLTIKDWGIDDGANTPSATTEFGGTVTYKYRIKDSGDEFSEEIPNDIGEYELQATSEATANYTSDVKTEVYFKITEESQKEEETFLGKLFKGFFGYRLFKIFTVGGFITGILDKIKNGMGGLKKI